MYKLLWWFCTLKTIFLTILLITQVVVADDYYYKNNKRITLTSTSSMSKNSSNIDYYQTEEGIIVGVTTNLIVKLKDGNNLDNYLNEFNLTLVKTLSNNLYLLRSENKSLTLDISNRLSEKDDVGYAHPDFIKQRIRR